MDKVKDGHQKSLEFNLIGGLGNQLFVFYAGIAIAAQKKKIPVFNLSALEKSPHFLSSKNLYSLGILSEFETTNREYNQKKSARVRRKIEAYIRKFQSETYDKTRKVFFKTNEVGYVEPEVIPDHVEFLEGYFQTWRYYLQTPERFRYPLDCKGETIWFKEHYEEFKKNPPEIIHIRRGDYTHKRNSHIGQLSQEYYRNFVQRQIVSDKVWVFSDDYRAASEFLGRDLAGRCVFANPPYESDPYESMILMSLAKKICIANSTFSWWSAMFSKNSIEVHAPKKWFRKISDPVDLIPEKWITHDSRWIK